MLPNIIDSIEINNQSVFATSEGTLLTAFELSTFDMEVEPIRSIESQLISWIRELPTHLRVRFILNSESSYKTSGHSRQAALSRMGFVQNKLYVFFEQDTHPIEELVIQVKGLFKKESFFTDRARNFLSDIPLETLKSIDSRMTSLNLENIKSFFPNQDVEASKDTAALRIDGNHLGILKFIRQTSSQISVSTLARQKDLLSLPYSVVVTIQNNSPVKTEERLRRKSNQTEQGRDLLSFKRHEEIQKDMTKTVDQGARFISVETQILLNRKSPIELSNASKDAIERLRPLGLFYKENIGLYPSWIATLPGSKQHYPFFEIDEVVPSYLPLFTYGTSTKKTNTNKDSLFLHRQDESIDAVSIFNPAYDSFSANIIGLPGSGKSVLTNMLTRALFADPDINIVKLDVGGSHSRETQILGGTEYEFSVGRPAGFNPLKFVKQAPKAKELIQILGTFLEVLIKEEHEFFFSKEMKADLEKAIGHYIENASEAPGIDDLLKVSGDLLPRRKLLERWSSRGVYGSAFIDNDEILNQDSRLKYFNFAKIAQAMDGDFSQGGFAAVMAAFNFDMLFNRRGKRFVFLADEVPVFIQRCFSFFDLSISNIRKEGDGFVTIAQRSSHLVVNGNTSILDGSPSKFLFTVDGDPAAYAKRLALEEATDIERIKNLHRVQGKFSEVYHVDPLGKRSYKIVLSPEEYWSYTSKKEDKDKIQNLLQAVPGLTIKEAIKCLGL